MNGAVIKTCHNETVLNRIKHVQNEVKNLQKEKIKTNNLSPVIIQYATIFICLDSSILMYE